MKSHKCYCGRELFAGATKCETCIKALARRNSGKRSRERGKHSKGDLKPLDVTLIPPEFRKYVVPIFTRSEA